MRLAKDIVGGTTENIAGKLEMLGLDPMSGELSIYRAALQTAWHPASAAAPADCR